MKRKNTKQNGFICRFVREDKGTQLIELAIILPVMLMMMAATAEFGRFFYTYTTLAKATRAGARYLATSAVKSTEDTRARNLIVYGDTTGEGNAVVSGLTEQNVRIVRTGGVPVLPETVTVEIDSYTYTPIFDLGKITGQKNLSLNIEVSPSTTMRYLLTQPPI
ncbi:MAG: TadE/TadG family type IV pilus assembly protein [Pyrinomonadaceae bacterium]|jgi:Flp pilus assembly protein TadG